MARLVTLQDLRNDPLITTLIAKETITWGTWLHESWEIARYSGGRPLLRYTGAVGKSRAREELAAIAGYLHDIGNVINRRGHSQSGALLAMTIMRRIGMDPAEIAVVAGAIGNHDETANRLAGWQRLLFWLTSLTCTGLGSETGIFPPLISMTG